MNAGVKSGTAKDDKKIELVMRQMLRKRSLSPDAAAAAAAGASWRPLTFEPGAAAIFRDRGGRPLAPDESGEVPLSHNIFPFAGERGAAAAVGGGRGGGKLGKKRN